MPRAESDLFVAGVAAALFALPATALAETPCEEGRDATELRLLARQSSSAGNYDDALHLIDCALRIAPDDLDIRLARARILLWQGRLEEARHEADFVSSLEPQYPELADLNNALRRSSQRRAAAYLTTSWSNVTTPTSDQTWKGVSLGSLVALDPRHTIVATLDFEDRGFATDTRIQTRFERQIDGGFVYLSASGTPNADFREQWAIAGGFELPLGDTTLIGDYRHAQYADSSIDVVSPAVRIPLGTERVSLTLKGTLLASPESKLQAGVSGRLDAQLPRDYGIAAGLATYPDTEAGITRQVRGAFASFRIPVSDRISLSVTGDIERRKASYTRRGIALGLSWRFGR
ncbi:YaiO family outer membrane beta-barrel protein [Qipengyuania sp.]|uniref:YaiO family outer membrane beta-barrel protein n=1 Tax=Qipengyuania sp. TaxID=2004515 RepID=UPI003AF90496